MNRQRPEMMEVESLLHTMNQMLADGELPDGDLLDNLVLIRALLNELICEIRKENKNA